MLFLFIFIHLYDRAEHTCEDPLTPVESELLTLPEFIPIDEHLRAWHPHWPSSHRALSDLGAVQFVKEPTRGRVYGEIQ